MRIHFNAAAAAGVLALWGSVSASPAGRDVALAERDAANPARVRAALDRIRDHPKHGVEFCEAWLHAPGPRTVYTTVTRTVGAGANKPKTTGTTTTTTATETDLLSVTQTQSETLPAVTQTSSDTITETYTSTTSVTTTQTQVVTSTVATVTVTSVSEADVATTTTSYILAERRRHRDDAHRRRRQHIPSWLRGFCDEAITKACERIVDPHSNHKTVTCTETVTVPRAPAAAATTTATSTVLTTTKASETATTTLLLTPTTTAFTSTTTTVTDATPTTLSFSATSTSVFSATATATTSTTVTSTKSTVTVSLPQPTINARIRVLGADGSTIGYLGPLSSTYGTTGLATDSSDAVVFTLDLAGSSGAGQLINILTPAGSSYPYLGVVFTNSDLNNSGDGYLSSASDVWLNLGYVAKVAASSQSTDKTQNSLVDDLQNAYESQVWSYDRNSHVLSVVWTQPDGTQYTPNSYFVSYGVVQFFEWGSPAFFSAEIGSSVGQAMTLVAEPVF